MGMRHEALSISMHNINKSSTILKVHGRCDALG
jgi:hypothetical protein